MRRHLLSAVAVACLAGTAVGGAGVYNGGFEISDAEGRVRDWAYDPDFFRLDPAGGRNGTACLAFDGRAGENGSPLQQRLRAVPGKTYECSVWLRGRNGVSSQARAGVRVVWEDRYGHKVGTSEGVKNAVPASWTALKERVSVPAQADWASVRIECDGLLADEILFDDVRLAPAE